MKRSKFVYTVVYPADKQEPLHNAGDAILILRIRHGVTLSLLQSGALLVGGMQHELTHERIHRIRMYHDAIVSELSSASNGNS